MSRGRPPMGTKLVDQLAGSDHARQRLKLFLETLSGETSVVDAAGELGVSEAAFHKMRSQFLDSAVDSLEPKPAGRPRKETDAEAESRKQYQERIAELELDLEAARVREQIALAMPELFKDQQLPKNPSSNHKSKKTNARKRKWKRRKR